MVTRLLHERQRGRQVERLTVLGVLPGVELEVIRSRPAVVFQLGHSQFAIDEELAGLILVQPEGGVLDGST
jgi:Fe2+ transport system protein FeoA